MRIAWLMLCLPFGAMGAPLQRFDGTATTSDGRIAYREVHWQRGTGDGAERWVQYECPDGRPFARKQMPASALTQVRGYGWEDRRSGQAASINAAGGTVRISWKEDASANVRASRIPLPSDAVIDTGFDAAVRNHWAALMRGERLSLSFLVPGRQRFYPVQVHRRNPVRWQGIPAQSIEVKLDTWYGVVAQRLSLVYADADRRLLEFRGPSNLRNAQGGYPMVTVRFTEAASARSAQEWQQAWGRPLVDRCAATGSASARKAAAGASIAGFGP